MDRKITDIHCPKCGAPAKFDIVEQKYLCSYCDGKVEIGEALQQARGFRKIQIDKLRNSAKEYHLFNASCSGCGATVVFEENVALSNCAFCGSSLVRRKYLFNNNMPENIIPFRITSEEAGNLLEEWCRKNSGKQEAKLLRKKIDTLKGYYLPYELICGPVHMRVSRMQGSREYDCEG